MKPAFRLVHTFVCLAFVIAYFGIAAAANAEPLTLKHAVELALVHSPAAGE